MNPANAVPGWHWPRFEAVLCGQMSDRERLGLPPRYVAARLDEALPKAYADLRGTREAALLDCLASAASPLAQRLASGNLLALLGDPRIDPLRPRMMDVPSAVVQIGLPARDVDAVLERLDGLGLDRAWIAKECPRHSVTLRAFRLARYPVTNAEYRVFLLDTGHDEVPSSWAFRQFRQACANHPVYTVSAASADAYARWLAERTGRSFRLPSEAEWEFAAAGPEGLEFPWGARFDAGLANTAETALFCSSPVGAFVGGESPFGLSDMAGNVEEYVADDYAAYPQGARVEDHLAQTLGAYRVARGGSFARFRDLARTRRRHGPNPRSATYAMGFRLAEGPLPDTFQENKPWPTC
jgi:toxoflavin biosynthesis protein ToxD